MGHNVLEEAKRFTIETSIAPWYPVTEDVTADVWQDIFASWPRSLGILKREELPLLKTTNPHVYALIYDSIWKKCYRWERTYDTKTYKEVHTKSPQIYDIGLFQKGALMCHRILRIQADTRASKLPRISGQIIRDVDLLPKEAYEGYNFHKIRARISDLLPLSPNRPPLFKNILDASRYVRTQTLWGREDDFLFGAYVLYAPFELLRQKSLSG